MATVFELFQDSLDPDNERDFTFPFRLNDGESIVSAQVDFVTADSSAVATGSLPSKVGVPNVGENPAPPLWGVTQWISGNSAPEGMYYVRCRITTDSTPPRSADKTMRLRVKNT